MDAADWAQQQAVFNAVLESPPEDRQRRLDALCAADPALRLAVQRLLDAHAADPDGLATASAATDTIDRAGQTLGDYALIEPLGRGGMGAVWLAERRVDGATQTVAVKVLHLGMNTAEVVRRFTRERRILATLNHPHICRLVDGGVTADGRPYFVMPLLEGAQPLDRWCAAQGADLPRRVALFVQVCRAVHHAHQALVVHADLKPANVLVSPEDEPYLLDFGIARLLAPETLGDETTAYAGPARPHTPAYASPEQQRGEPPGTSSDVYSLGVMLYELLGGERPDATPGRVSAHCGTAAAQMGWRPERLRRALAGDLDRIVAKAMAEEPAQRYASAIALAEDLERWRDGLPILARPPSVAYQLRKYIGRHPALSAMAATGTSLLLAITVTVLVLNAQIRESAEQVQRERDRAEAIAGFWGELFRETDPMTTDNPEEAVTAAELLDRAQTMLDADGAIGPRERARLLTVISEANWGLGRQEAALVAAQAAVAQHEAEPVPAAEYIDAYRHLSNIQTGLQNLAEGQAAAERALAQLDARGQPDPLRRSQVLNSLALAADELGDTATAAQHLGAAIELLREQPPELSGFELPTYIGNLAYMHFRLSQQPEIGVAEAQDHRRRADELLGEGIERMSALLGPEHPRVSILLHGRGVLAAAADRHHDAIDYYEQAAAIQTRHLPPTHDHVIHLRLSIGDAQLAAGDAEAAEQTFSTVLGHAREGFPEAHATHTQAQLGLARALLALERPAQAAAQLEPLLRILDTDAARAIPENDPTRQQTLALLTRLRLDAGDRGAAAALGERLREERSAAVEPALRAQIDDLLAELESP